MYCKLVFLSNVVTLNDLEMTYGEWLSITKEAETSLLLLNSAPKLELKTCDLPSFTTLSDFQFLR